MTNDEANILKNKFLIDIIIFYKNMNKYLNAQLPRECSLSIYEIFFILLLEDSEKFTYYELTKILPFDQSYINKIIKRLEKKGLLTRIKDGRKKRILLTEEAKEFLKERPKAKEDFLEVLRNADITDEEICNFIVTIKKISNILQKQTDGSYE